MFELRPPPVCEETGSDEHYTPRWLLRSVAEARYIDLDPCCDPSRGTPAETHFVGLEGEDGLARPWWGHVWLNPPYSDLTSWITKARAELDAERVELVTALIPFRPEGFWAGTIWHPGTAIGHFHQRIRFENPRGTPAAGSGRFPSALIVLAQTRRIAEYHAELITEELPESRASRLTWCATIAGM